MHLFFLDDVPADAPAAAGDRLSLTAEESRHLLKVLRARAGDPVALTDGRGRLYRGTVAGVEGGRAVVEIGGVSEDPEAVGAPRLHLACGVVKGRRFEWALEKAVELGVHVVWPLVTEHAVVKPRDGKASRWTTALRSAVKQSGRSWFPELKPPLSLPEMMAATPGADLFYGVAVPAHRERPDTAPRLIGPADVITAADGRAAPSDLVWIVGPEGGWSAEELTVLAAAARPVCLGPHRLRTETAAAAGIVLLQAARDRIRGRR